MKAIFIEEAEKYQVFPMDASVAARVIAPRPNITAGRSQFFYTTPMIGLPEGDSPLLLNTSYTISADVEVPQEGAEGMILTLDRPQLSPADIKKLETAMRNNSSSE